MAARWKIDPVHFLQYVIRPDENPWDLNIFQRIKHYVGCRKVYNWIYDMTPEQRDKLWESNTTNT